jgi:hypothetical protein
MPLTCLNDYCLKTEFLDSFFFALRDSSSQAGGLLHNKNIGHVNNFDPSMIYMATVAYSL